MTDWNLLSEPVQLNLAAAAFQQASDSIASYAEALAGVMYAGSISDRGGQYALRLFAAMVRAVSGNNERPAGHAH